MKTLLALSLLLAPSAFAGQTVAHTISCDDGYSYTVSYNDPARSGYVVKHGERFYLSAAHGAVYGQNYDGVREHRLVCQISSYRELTAAKKYYQLRRKDFESDDAFLAERCRLSGGEFDLSIGRCLTY